jgi:hypothetical protein
MRGKRSGASSEWNFRLNGIEICGSFSNNLLENSSFLLKSFLAVKDLKLLPIWNISVTKYMENTLRLYAV